MNEYFIKVEISFYQTGSEVHTYFIKADTGENAYKKIRDDIEYRCSHNPFITRKLTKIALIDIHRL